MYGRRVAISRPRRFVGDLLHFSAGVPTVPVQRRMDLAKVVAARNSIPARPSWPTIFIKAYADVADGLSPLRRAYLSLPWPHFREYPRSVATIAVEREHDGERCVFFGRIDNPAKLPLQQIDARIRTFAEAPVESLRSFRKMLTFAGLPRPLRRFLFRLALNSPRTRQRLFGTFGLSVYSSLGAESLHPLSPLTTMINYGVIEPGGKVWVRLIYDHRVFDGSIAARALANLEEVLNGSILTELIGYSGVGRLAG